jgi:hypothetical protein
MTQIDWTTIKNRADIGKIPDSVLFDQFETYAGGSAPDIREGLPDEDVEAAIEWLTAIPDLIGVCLIIGEEGMGKSLMAYALAYDSKYLFNKLAVLDIAPRSLFGSYVPFSTEFLKEQLARLKDMSEGNGKTTKDGRWVSSRGEVLIRQAVIMMDEFGGRHMSRLTSPMVEPKKSLLSLFSLNRHLQSLFLGVGTQLNDFDRHCFPHVDYIIGCTRVDPPPWDKEGSNIQIVGRIQRVRYNRDRDEFMPIGEPTFIGIAASEPRDYLNGYAYKNLFRTDNVQSPTISKGMMLKE